MRLARRRAAHPLHLETTEREDRFYWHVVIFREGEHFVLHRRKGEERIELSRYLLAGRGEAAA